MISGISLPAGADMAPDFMLTINQKDITQNIRPRLLSMSLT
ncbi:phage late control D family protein, partial [Yersinia kristensenii]|nr:phage late control D family protein [Yersinia kristensenii]